MKLIESMTNRQVGKSIKQIANNQFCENCLTRESCTYKTSDKKSPLLCTNRILIYMLETDGETK